MSPVLKIKRDNEAREILFELRYQMSLTSHERFELMFKKTKEIKELLEKSGHRKPFEIIKRTEGSGRPKELEDLILQISQKKVKR
jgi:hypothetical protein